MALRSMTLIFAFTTTSFLPGLQGADKPGSLQSCTNKSQTYPNREPNVWNGSLPGDVTEETVDLYGYPKSKPPDCLHGAEVVVGWTQTNSFARSFSLMYRILQVIGEPKHGLWRWHVPGVPDKAPQIWWCEMGGLNSDNLNATTGHEDSTDLIDRQSNMGKFWEVVRLRAQPAANQIGSEYGPLATEANLAAITKTAVQVYLNRDAGAKLWVNRGTADKPFWYWMCGKCKFEVYATEAFFQFPKMFNEAPCNGTDRAKWPTNSTSGQYDCALLHSFLIVVVEPSCMQDSPGLKSMGLHYAQDSTCPDNCGSKPCQCDALLVDIITAGPAQSQNLTWPVDSGHVSSVSDHHTFLPIWLNKDDYRTEGYKSDDYMSDPRSCTNDTNDKFNNGEKIGIALAAFFGALLFAGLAGFIVNKTIHCSLQAAPAVEEAAPAAEETTAVVVEAAPAAEETTAVVVEAAPAAEEAAPVACSALIARHDAVQKDQQEQIRALSLERDSAIRELEMLKSEQHQRIGDNRR